ncbi:ribose ABC transporter permease, partial [Mesorhizobium sp. M8A.F.Ca.ET.173.01.1.1]
MTDRATGITSGGDQAVVRSRRLRTAFAALGMLPVLVLLAAGFQFINPRFLTQTNLLIVTQQSSINIVLAAGMTFVILTG